MFIGRSAVGVTAAALLAVTVAGCGDDGDDNGVADLSADEILTEAKDAAAEAEWVRVTGEIPVDDGEIALDMSQGPEGAQGTMTNGGQTVELLLHNEDGFFMKANRSYWDETTGDARAGELFADRYVTMPPGQDMTPTEWLMDRSKLIDNLLSPGGEISKGETSNIDGVDVITLLDEDGGMLHVSTTGEPYPIRIESSMESGAVDFLWEEPVKLNVPDHDEVVDISDLQ